MTDVRDEIATKEIGELSTFAHQLSSEMRELIQSIASRGFESELKRDKSVVTTADLEAERLVRRRVAECYPNHGVLGEEFGIEREQADFRWVVDPVDGTAEFATGLPLYGSILGLFYKGKPLVGIVDHPALNQRVHATHGQGAWNGDIRLSFETNAPLSSTSRIGITAPANFMRYEDEMNVFMAVAKEFPVLRIYHSCSMHSAVACSALDVGIEWNLKPWDFAALQVIIEEAGGVYRELRHDTELAPFPVISAVFGPESAVDSVCSVIESA